MTELWLKFKDENGAPQRVLVEGQKFSIGRTPDNSLGIPLANLSRRHAQIDRFGDIFVLSDAGSSNGTTLDGKLVSEPVALKNGDKFNLGGNAEVEVEIISDEPAAPPPDANAAADGSDQATGAAAAASGAANSSGSSMPTGLFILAPVLGILVIAAVGIGIFVSGSKQETPIGKSDDGLVYNSPNSENPNIDLSAEEEEEPEPEPTTKSTAKSSSTTTATTSTPASGGATTDDPPAPKVSGDADKLERASVSFMRRIGANDTKSFLTGKQIAVVTPKIDQFKNSPALAANLKNAKQNAAQLEELARSKNLRAQFVTTAALAQLGNKPGDVLQTARGMIETLSNLRASLGNELADDTLLIIAAYDQGLAGQNLAMRDTVAGLANKFPNVSSRTVRTIWFLRDNGKLSDAQYEFVLKFLAIGIITQNPKDFNVQSEAMIFS